MISCLPKCAPAPIYQNGPGGFGIGVTHAPKFGLLHFMTVDPTPQLIRQSANEQIYFIFF